METRAFLVSILRSTPNHKTLKYMCPNFCYVGISSTSTLIEFHMQKLEGLQLLYLDNPKPTWKHRTNLGGEHSQHEYNLIVLDFRVLGSDEMFVLG